MFFVNIFKGLIYLVKSFFDNLYLLYLYAYIIYGIYLATKHKEELNTTYIFFGLILITIFFIDYIDKKFKLKEKYTDPKKELWEKKMALTERILNERINELSSLIEEAKLKK